MHVVPPAPQGPPADRRRPARVAEAPVGLQRGRERRVVDAAEAVVALGRSRRRERAVEVENDLEAPRARRAEHGGDAGLAAVEVLRARVAEDGPRDAAPPAADERLHRQEAEAQRNHCCESLEDEPTRVERHVRDGAELPHCGA